MFTLDPGVHERAQDRSGPGVKETKRKERNVLAREVGLPRLRFESPHSFSFLVSAGFPRTPIIGFVMVLVSGRCQLISPSGLYVHYIGSYIDRPLWSMCISQLPTALERSFLEFPIHPTAYALRAYRAGGPLLKMDARYNA